MWAAHNELLFQPTKFVNLRVSHKRQSIARDYTVGEVTLKRDSSVRNLGVAGFVLGRTH